MSLMFREAESIKRVRRELMSQCDLISASLHLFVCGVEPALSSSLPGKAGSR